MEADQQDNGDFEMSDSAGNNTNGQVVIGPVAPGGDNSAPAHEKGNEDRKIFVGGLSYETTNEDLLAYFQQFGEVTQAQVKYDQLTGRSRGFAFVEFGNANSVQEVLKQREREVKGKKVEVKPAKSRENKKIFVGGLPSDFPEDQLKTHFEQFGKVDDVEWPFDRTRGLRRNFAFVVFEEESAADAASAEAKQRFGDRMCDVKKAVPQPKRAMMGMGMGGGVGGGRGGTRGRGRGGQTGQYGSYGAMGGYGNPGGYGGGWGDWYGNYYGTGYGGGGYGGYDESAAYNTDSYNYWSGWGQYGAAAGGAGAGGYDSYGQAQGAAGAQNARGGRYQPY